MKDSGIEWLGEIPAEWEIRQLKRVAWFRSSNVDKITRDDENSVQLCNYTDVYYAEHITDSICFMNASATQNQISQFQLKSGDVIITKDSEASNDIAVPAFVPKTLPNVICGYHLALIRSYTDIVFGEYLFRAFQTNSIALQFEIEANGITRYGLSLSSIGNALFPIPPLEEQRLIIEYINEQSQKIDTLIYKTQQTIENLKEYRISLISAAVTGKIDVRGVIG